MLFNKQVKKYMLTRETKVVGVVTLHRIKALKDFGNIKKGDLGGWIEKEENLSHDGDCWVSGNARVFGNAIVQGYAMVFGDARVYGDAKVYGDAMVHGNADVFGCAEVYENAKVYGDAMVHGNTEVHGCANVFGNTEVFGNGRVFGYVNLSGNVRLSTDANIRSNSDYIIIGPIGSRDGYTTVYKTHNTDTDSKIRIQCGCFNGTPDEFFTKVRETHPKSSMYYKQYTMLVGPVIHTLNGKED